tara:strand:+ start:24222 stop:25622 length:1401 start_codon:yes stop_codon:yes gene_type:complete
MTTRRDFLRSSLFSASAMACMNPTRLWSTPEKPPMRFIFMHRGNGLWPKVMVPPSFDRALQKKEQRKEPFEADLAKHELPAWMSPLSKHVDNLTILQGLSGKMCTTGHHSWCSSLGVFKANERLSSIRWATVDFELARLFPSPAEHIELACFPDGGGNARGSLDGIATGFSARGAQQPNYAFGSPRVALDELFKSVSQDATARTQYQLERKLLAFVAKNEGATASDLAAIEKAKVQGYADSIQAIRERNRKIDGMAERIRKHVPQLDEKLMTGEINTFERQIGHTEVLLGALISGLSNVIAFTVDELGHPYTGITGIEGEKVNMHDVGHNKSFGGVDATEIRARCRKHHMSLVDRIVTRLKSVPEAGGTMFDNTMLCYFPDGGEAHHSHGTEYPFVVLAGDNAKLQLGGRYVRLPNYGKPGHKTLGNWYTTLLNAYGNPIEHYGAVDTGLDKFGINQLGPIAQFLP